MYASHVQQGGQEMKALEYEEYFVKLTAGGTHLFVVTDTYKGDDRPVGLLVQNSNGQAYESHVWWMQWASKRDKLTAALTFIDVMRDEQTILVYSMKEDNRLWEQMGRYGVFRKVGRIHKYFPQGADALVWQSRPR